MHIPQPWSAVARILDHSHQLVPPHTPPSLHLSSRLQHRNITTHTASKCFYTPTYQTSLGVPWGRRTNKTRNEGERTGTPSRVTGRLPDVTLASTAAALLAYSSGGGCLLLTSMGTKPEITNE